MRGPIGYGPGMHGMLGIFGAIVGFLGTLILIAVVVAVLFFLIRFLIVGTKAAQLYIDANRAAPVVEPVETTSTGQVSTGSTSDAAGSTSAVPKTRKPKA